MAVGFVLDKLHPAASNDTAEKTSTPSIPGGEQQTSSSEGSEVKGSRSVTYSLAAYLLGAPSARLLLLCAFQALLTGFLCAVTFRLFADRQRPSWRRVAILSFVTPVAFVVCLTIPDIFSALIILSIVLLATSYARMSSGVAALCALIAAAGVTFHSSNLPIALAMTILSLALLGWQRWRKVPVARLQWGAVLAPLLLGVGVTSLANAVAFGGASLTGKRYPLTLARSIAEGPGKWYLDRNCRHSAFAVCELYPAGVPSTIPDFLWGKNGLKERATAEQMDRIRAEEADVVLAATLAYPAQEVERISWNVARQLVRFEPGVSVLDGRIVLEADGQPVLQTVSYSRWWTTLVGWLTIASVLTSLVFLTRRFLSDAWSRPIIGLIVAGILVNAFVCVYFSGIADRYNTRTIWLLPLLALALHRKKCVGAAPTG